MPALSEILSDPNYVNANPATKQAIFEKHSATDPNYTGANDATKSAIRQKFGIADALPQRLGAPTQADEPSLPYILGKVKEGVASVPGLVAMAADIPSFPFGYIARGLGLKKRENFPVTKAYYTGIPEVMGYDPNAPVPKDPWGKPKLGAEMAGHIGEFSGMNILPGAGVVSASARPLVALGKEIAGVVAAGEGATMGAHLAPEGYKTAGEIIGSMSGPLAVQGIIEGAFKGGNWIKSKSGVTGLSEESRLSAGTEKAAKELRPQLTSPVSQANIAEAEAIGLQIPGFKENLTLGQATDAPVIKAMQRHFGGTDVTAHETGLAKQEGIARSIEKYGEKKFPSTPDVSATQGARVAYENKIARLDEATNRLEGQQAALASKYMRGDMEAVGADIRDVRQKLMAATKSSASAKFNAVYDAAEKMGLKVNMEDVNTLAETINKDAGRAFQNDPGVIGKILGRYGEKPIEPKYQVTEGGLIPIESAPVSKEVDFKEFHSLYKDANLEASQLAIAAKMGHADAAQKLREVNKMRDLLRNKVTEMEGAQHGNVGALLKNANQFYDAKYRKLFKTGVGGEIGKTGQFGVSVEDSKLIPRIIFKKGDASGVEEYIAMSQGDHKAYQALEDGIMDTFAKAATKDGKIDPHAVANFLRDYKEPLDYLPAIKSKISTVEGAVKSLAENRQRVVLEQRDFSKSILKKVASTENADTAVANALKSPRHMHELLSNAKTVEEKQAVAKGIMEQVIKQPSPMEFMNRNEKMLVSAMGEVQFGHLNTIMRAEQIAKRTIAPSHLDFEKMVDPLSEKTGTSIPQAISEQKSVAQRFASPQYAVARVGMRWWNKLRNDKREEVLMGAIYDPEQAIALSKYLSDPTLKQVDALNPHLIPYGVRVSAELQNAKLESDAEQSRARRKAQRK